MNCRETQPMLTAFHDGELHAADRARVEEHLRGCPECVALLAGLARIDRAADVPDPGPAYWNRFNARVMDRIAQEADGPGVTVLRPKGGWMRQQLRYLVPAAAAAVLVVMVVRYGGMTPGTPAPTAPGAVSERATPDSAGERMAKAQLGSDGQGRPGAGAGRDVTDSVAPARAKKKAESTAVAQRVPEEYSRVAEAPATPPPAIADERLSTAARGERDRLADRPLPSGNVEASRDRATSPAVVGAPSPTTTFQKSPEGQGRPGAGAGRDATGSVAPSAASPSVAERHSPGEAKSASGMNMAKDQSAEAPAEASLGKTRSKEGPSSLASAPSPASSPCERARALAVQERWREAEAVQRACLVQDPSTPAREKGLVFLAELLDRQARFAEADAVIAEVDRQFPQSRPLDLYRQQRPMVQKQPITVPVPR